MKVLLVAMGTDGDVYPFIALGLVMRERGHEVVLLANEHYADRVCGTLGYEPLGTESEHRRIVDDPAFWDPLLGSRVVAEWGMSQIRRQYAAIERLYEPGRTVVASPASVIGARLAQERLGISLATIVLQPVVFRSLYRLPVMPGVPRVPSWMPRFVKAVFWKGVDALADRVMASRISAFRCDLGLTPVKRILEWWLSPDLVIAMFPSWYATPQPDWPTQVRVTGFPMYDHRRAESLPPDVREFLDREDRPIVFTPGTGVGHGQMFFQAAAGACRLMGRRGMLLSRFRTQVPPNLPPSIRHFDYVPFGQLFSHVAAVVHHGGIGTVSHALAAGVPQLIMPRSFDQPDNAQRVRARGLGDVIKPSAFRASRIAQKLTSLLESQAVRENCRKVVGLFPMEDPLQRACELIERQGAMSRPEEVSSVPGVEPRPPVSP